MVFAHRQILLWFLILPLAACRSYPATENGSPNATAPTFNKIALPFSNQEPETFQTEIVITSQTGSAKSERRYFLARSGAKRLLIFGRATERETAILQTVDGKSFLLDYAAKTIKKSQIATNSGSDLSAFLTTEYLSRKSGAAFEKTKTENNLTEYRVKIENAGETEILITVDENLRLPVRQEFFRLAGEQKILLYTIELKNFSTTAEDELFVVPQDFRSIE